MSKHTPGQWEIIPQSIGGSIIAHPFETSQQLNPTGLRLICQMWQRGSSLAEDQANASLIAAAPELLEALKEARRYVVGAYECAFPDDSENAAVLVDIDAAIAKAEGEPARLERAK